MCLRKVIDECGTPQLLLVLTGFKGPIASGLVKKRNVGLWGKKRKKKRKETPLLNFPNSGCWNQLELWRTNLNKLKFLVVWFCCILMLFLLLGMWKWTTRDYRDGIYHVSYHFSWAFLNCFILSLNFFGYVFIILFCTSSFCY